MENLNETDGGQLTSNQEIDPAIVKDMYDGFLQFQSSFNIPKEDWGIFDKGFDPSQFHLDISLNSLLEDSKYADISDIHKEYENSGMDHFGTKSKDKSRLFKISS